MSFVTLTPEIVETIHDDALNPGELAGRAKGKSLDGALTRVDNRLAYGMIGDVFDLAASYAVVIATGHCFNDANKRTAFNSMAFCLAVNGHPMAWDTVETGDLIVRMAQGLVGETDLAAWLRTRAP